MTRTLLATGTAMLLSILGAGCFRADVEVPDYSGYGQPAPPAHITPGDPNDKADMLRENQQLRDRLAYLENQNRRLTKKYQSLGADMAKVREETKRLESERDRYNAEAGR